MSNFLHKCNGNCKIYMVLLIVTLCLLLFQCYNKENFDGEIQYGSFYDFDRFFHMNEQVMKEIKKYEDGTFRLIFYNEPNAEYSTHSKITKPEEGSIVDITYDDMQEIFYGLQLNDKLIPNDISQNTKYLFDNYINLPSGYLYYDDTYSQKIVKIIINNPTQPRTVYKINKLENDEVQLIYRNKNGNERPGEIWYSEGLVDATDDDIKLLFTFFKIYHKFQPNKMLQNILYLKNYANAIMFDILGYKYYDDNITQKIIKFIPSERLAKKQGKELSIILQEAEQRKQDINKNIKDILKNQIEQANKIRLARQGSVQTVPASGIGTLIASGPVQAVQVVQAVQTVQENVKKEQESEKWIFFYIPLIFFILLLFILFMFMFFSSMKPKLQTVSDII